MPEGTRTRSSFDDIDQDNLSIENERAGGRNSKSHAGNIEHEHHHHHRNSSSITTRRHSSSSGRHHRSPVESSMRGGRRGSARYSRSPQRAPHSSNSPHRSNRRKSHRSSTNLTPEPRQNLRGERQPEDPSLTDTPAKDEPITEKDSKKKRRCMIIFVFFLFLVGAGIVTWMLVSGLSIPDQSSQTVDDPANKDVVKESDIRPSSAPSASPSFFQGDITNLDNEELQWQDVCMAVGNGTYSVSGGQGSMATQEYDLLLDVILDSDEAELKSLLNELTKKMQLILMPSLVGCTEEGQGDNGIVNALVEIEEVIDGECLLESTRSCNRVVAHLEIVVKSIVSSGDFRDIILLDFLEVPLVERLGLTSPFKIIELYKIFSDSSRSPTMDPTSTPSSIPTFRPSPKPTPVPSPSPSGQLTLTPTRYPTNRPWSPSPTTRSPTRWPTHSPTTLWPTRWPSHSPTTRSPTRWPTSSPTTPSPTRWPTPLPTTPSPTRSPTASPRYPCFQTNDDLRDAAACWTGWNNDLSDKLAVEAQRGPIEAWCFGPGVTTMAYLFSYPDPNLLFNPDVSNWDVSGISQMQSMFQNCEHFNQDLSQWNVSSVTDVSYMFQGASLFNQNLCPWATRLPSSANVNMMFSYGTSCPDNSDPNLISASPPGPFCHVC